MADVGTIGELKVIEHLDKIEKHTIYLPLKDRGIDFITTKGDRTYFFQIKTSSFQKNSYFWFDLYKHKMKYSENTYYIFVCMIPSRHKMMGKSKHFIVVPSMKLKQWIEKGYIAAKSGNEDVLNIFLYPDNTKKKWIYRNKKKELDWTKYWNNFNLR